MYKYYELNRYFLKVVGTCLSPSNDMIYIVQYEVEDKDDFSKKVKKTAYISKELLEQLEGFPF